MEILPHNSTTCLELTMAMPGFSSSTSFPSSGEKEGGAKKELDINEAPSATEEGSTFMEEEDDEIHCVGPARRKKLRLTKEQYHLLEENFLQNQTLNPKEKEALAVELKLKPRQVEVWFQNRRARSKMKQTEIECEYLKRWLGGLMEQNRRLHREVEDMKTKVAPPHCHHPLIMCPRCHYQHQHQRERGHVG